MNMNPLIHNQRILEKTVPSMRYDGSRPFAEWQKEARSLLSELLGLDKMEKCDGSFALEYKKELDGYTEYRFTVESERDYYFPAVLRIPRGLSGKAPVIICLQGHSTGFHISLGEPKFPRDKTSIASGDRDFAVRAVKEGYAALAIEQRCCGVCGSNSDGIPYCELSSMVAIMNGRTTIGERVWDVSRAIDALENHFSELVETDKVCLMGNSGGGTATYYAAAIDERIKLAMPSCAVCSWEESIAAMDHCICNYVPHIAEHFNMSDIGGLIAPRPLIIVNGKTDEIFRKKGVDATFEEVKKLYATAGAPDACRHVEGPEGHRFYADASWPVLHELKKKI